MWLPCVSYITCIINSNFTPPGAKKLILISLLVLCSKSKFVSSGCQLTFVTEALLGQSIQTSSGEEFVSLCTSCKLFFISFSMSFFFFFPLMPKLYASFSLIFFFSNLSLYIVGVNTWKLLWNLKHLLKIIFCQLYKRKKCWFFKELKLLQKFFHLEVFDTATLRDTLSQIP